MQFSPVAASESIVEKYKRYLRTIFQISDDSYQKQFEDALNQSGILEKGPYLDVSDSFVKGKSVAELIDENVLSPSFSEIQIPLDRPLYAHQEKAIRALQNKRNLIVSTGTGSGKTESFLLPILNSILQEADNGTLDSGVRALLIYPMNALANDQIERLRSLLANCPQITYGSYTGQTKARYSDALADYMSLNNGENPIANELISREQMKEKPPHILITNYAMLEYLMLRPDDSVFFSSFHAHKWKYIVLDEAHVYNGSSGIEVSMLLRRLKAKLNCPNIQYILTSATLGDEQSNQEVADFGINLCDCAFSANDIIRAERCSILTDRDAVALPIGFYMELNRLLDEDASEQALLSYLKPFSLGSIHDSFASNIYEILLHDSNYQRIKNLSAQTQTIQSLAKQMNWSHAELSAFVSVASKAEHNGIRLFDARYHMFLRATESVFITLAPNKRLFLTRKRKHVECDSKEYAVFEAATCSVCHALYLVGKIDDEMHLVQTSTHSADELRSVFLLQGSFSDSDDEHNLETENMKAEKYEVCARCGFIRKFGKMITECCEHGNDYMVPVIKIDCNAEHGTLTKCLSCENTNTAGILRLFFTGQEAVTSVIGTALFEELPSYQSVSASIVETEDEFGFQDSDTDVQTLQMQNEAKQFIAFSDSRQAAAFFASYFEQSYQSILYKRLIVETMKHNAISHVGISVPEFVKMLSAAFLKYHITDINSMENLAEAWKAVLQELCDQNGNTSLFHMGLISFSFLPSIFSANTKLGLSSNEVCTLCNILATGMYSDAAVLYDHALSKADKEFFTHNGIEYDYTKSDPDTSKYRRAFIPRHTNRKNKRSDYLMRLLDALGKSAEIEKVNETLGSIWDVLFVRKELVRSVQGHYQVDCAKIRITNPSDWYFCPCCHRITPYNIRGVCPSYQCNGTLTKITPDEHFKDNHYFEIYQTLDIRKLRVVEHTAQLNKETAYDYQKKFKQKQIDVLSCSTTFEMGVDVGSLETVFMRNMPPSPANYAQRAGRAGRSKDAAAFALTFCNKSNHDFSFFANPLQMMKGRIEPPKFNIENEKIAIRHIYASALSFFWKKYPQYFSNTASMIEASSLSSSGVQAFQDYLGTQPEDLKQFLLRFLPISLSEQFDITHFGWLASLFSTDEEQFGVMTKAVQEYQYEIDVLEKARQEAFLANRSSDRLTERIRVFRNEDILSFFSRKNILPKYGFPVDTVELSGSGRGASYKMGLQLQRDLAMAISEYAPGSQIVANGMLLTSRYIRKIPKLGWKMYDYIRCTSNDCNTLNISPHTGETPAKELSQCRSCGETLRTNKVKTFLIPLFGFETDGNMNEKPSLRKPEHTYRGEISYVGKNPNQAEMELQINDAKFEIILSKGDEMAVLNESNFFVCESCGYTDLDEKNFSKMKRQAHNNSKGYPCANRELKHFSLGYRFETDVIQLRFITPQISDYRTALSLLYGVLRGICSYLNIEQNDIAGCLQYFFNPVSSQGNFSLVFYDRTPGGAGHVRRIASENTLKNVLQESLRLMKSCNCGGEEKDSSCYTCLRNYYNQKYHDILSRGLVIEILEKIRLDGKKLL